MEKVKLAPNINFKTLSDGTSVIYRTIGSSDDLRVMYTANESASDCLKLLEANLQNWIELKTLFSMYRELFNLETIQDTTQFENEFYDVINQMKFNGIIEKTS